MTQLQAKTWSGSLDGINHKLRLLTMFSAETKKKERKKKQDQYTAELQRKTHRENTLPKTLKGAYDVTMTSQLNTIYLFVYWELVRHWQVIHLV